MLRLIYINLFLMTSMIYTSISVVFPQVLVVVSKLLLHTSLIFQLDLEINREYSSVEFLDLLIIFQLFLQLLNSKHHSSIFKLDQMLVDLTQLKSCLSDISLQRSLRSIRPLLMQRQIPMQLHLLLDNLYSSMYLLTSAHLQCATILHSLIPPTLMVSGISIVRMSLLIHIISSTDLLLQTSLDPPRPLTCGILV